MGNYSLKLNNSSSEGEFNSDSDFLVEPDCHGASCLQANDAEGRKDDRLKKEEKKRI